MILKYEIDRRKVAWWGLTELRDFATHIAIALQSNDESVAHDAINSAKEHLRRAALETMQEYSSDIYAELKPKIDGSALKYKILMLPPPDQVKVGKLDEEVKKHLLDARSNKGDDWIVSVNSFYEAIKDLQAIAAEYPTINEVRFRIFCIIIGFFTILGAISGIIWLINLIRTVF